MVHGLYLAYARGLLGGLHYEAVLSHAVLSLVAQTLGSGRLRGRMGLGWQTSQC